MALINKNSGPSYLQLKKILISKIRGMEAGANLPSIRKLMSTYHVSQATVEKALFQLEQKGLVYREQGKGTFVGDAQKQEMRSAESSPSRQEVRSPRLLGLIVPTTRLSFFSDIISGVEDASSRNGHQVILCSANEDPSREKRDANKLLCNRAVNGLVVVTGKKSHQNTALFQQMSQRIPLVIVDIFLEGVEADYVTSDDTKGSCEAVKHLIELGHRRILHLAGPGEDSTAAARYDGYKNALLEHEIEFDQAMVRETGWEHDRGYLEMKKFLINNEKGRTAVFACNDEVAAGAFKAVREKGLQVPHDIALVGFGNLDIGPLLEVPLTTVDQSPVDIGVAATGFLLERIKHKNIPVRKATIPTRLVVRESCGAKLVEKTFVTC